MRKISQVLLIAMFIVGFATVGFSQRLTGSLEGRITDEDTNPLPGVTITLSSPALLGSRDFVTAETGNFRFPALPPGTYEMICELPGFKTMRRTGIIIRVGKTTTISVIMEQSPVQEEVTVTAEAPVVDVKSTKVAVNFSKDLLNNIPLSRDIYAVMLSAPGSVEGDFAGSFSSHGSTVAGSRYSLDGVDLTDPTVSLTMTNYNFDLIEEVEMELGAHGAEIGNVSGAYVNVVTRSGGNDFHGNATAYYFNESMVDTNFTDEQLDALGVSGPSLEKLAKDFSLSVGGPILKDKLWFFVSGRYLYNELAVSNFPRDVEHKELFGFGKLTWQIAKSIKLTGMINKVDTTEPIRNVSLGPGTTPEATIRFEKPSIAINGHLNWILNQNAFLDIRASWSEAQVANVQQPGSTFQNFDAGTGQYTGSYQNSSIWWRGRYQVNPDLTLFIDDVLGGDHELKIGGGYEYVYNDAGYWADPPVNTYSRSGSPYYLGGNQSVFIAWGHPPEKGESKLLNRVVGFAGYIQDSWTIKDRVTLNLGVRYSRKQANLPAQFAPEITYWTWLDPVFFGRQDYPEVKDLIHFNTFSPRFGLTFDVFGTGKTILKLNAARYFDYLQGTFFYRANPNTNSLRQYLWIDNNLDGQFDPGDTYNLLFSSGRLQSDPRAIYDPDLKVPTWAEFIVSLDHELMRDFRLGVNYIYKHHTNLFDNVEINSVENWAKPYTVTDPGFDGIFGTGDDAQLDVWDRSNPNEGIFYTNPEGAYAKYQGLEIVFDKRMSNNWQLFGSIVFSKSYGTSFGGLGETQGSNASFNTPNWLVNRDGRLGFDTPLVLKLQGSYQLPWRINLSAFFFATSGTPITRALNVYLPQHGSYVGINAEPPGLRRNPSTNRLDLRLEKEFTFADFGRLGIFLDVFNATNAGEINVTSGLQGYITANGSFLPNPLWQTVNSVSFPRRIKIGLRFTF